MDRRDFLKKTCGTCAAISLGTMLSATFMDACKTASVSVYKATPSQGTIAVPASSFATTDFKLIRVSNYGYDVGVIKNGSSYTALLLMCTHAGQALTKTGSGYFCPLHGSRFSGAGEVIKGPATDPLQHLKTKLVNEDVVIQLDPDYFFS
ncbi:QcrA and Rieske domain-containing protein [Arachidicoccus terrestris]|uniref:QcrA and Rieske domain-containing protein n=1 Tax=Arachidicoccus terrestris TaxID=2875539 RepID=UPI001CC79494|nr:Rieske 2Fe-2S domain-containing protein [Arachidicoccus terrestris]UAY55309.1 Rieske 2Fe-2S domain-containing protein [Arachidicoccus terrestris]